MQRFGNMAGVFLVMASAVRALDHSDAEREFLRKIAKIATAEIVSSKVSDTVKSLSSRFFLKKTRREWQTATPHCTKKKAARLEPGLAA